MASRSLLDLSPVVRRAALAFLDESRACGLDVLIYCTLRSKDEQTMLYAQGRTAPGAVVTQAKPGQSLHNPDDEGFAWAFDAVPMVGGKPAWDDGARLMQMGICGESCGLEWAGRWDGSIRERVHFQIRKEGVKNG